MVCRFGVGIHSAVDLLLRLSLSITREQQTETTMILLFKLCQCHSIIYQYYIFFFGVKSMREGEVVSDVTYKPFELGFWHLYCRSAKNFFCVVLVSLSFSSCRRQISLTEAAVAVYEKISTI